MMVRETRTYLRDSDDIGKSTMARRHLTRKEFGKRLYTLMLGKGWTQSELARQADVLRDSVSNYVRGLDLPGPQNLKKLAKALDTTAEDLLPNVSEAAIDMETDPALEIKASQDDPSRSWVRLNREVSTSTVLKIMQALEEDAPAASAKGGRR
jgi:transcriptional regulator with XRE-family HTH domain